MELIDKTQVINRLWDASEKMTEGTTEQFWLGVAQGLKDAVSIIQAEMKPVEPKRGHWISHGHTCGFWCECSECGFPDAHGDDDYKYCPECGARMGDKD